ncbi:hypothetical protein CC2G_011412 [Coprinopsis cinerea AmutBmut pab1-1]|nr:hypothetical protein CC2G_011412 [Coprinopsis cinerea AmutBmut pab1-1]
MPWPTRIARQFQIIPEGSGEMDLHGPYNKLLNYMFSPTSEYTVIPRSSFSITAKERPNPETGKPPELAFMLFEIQYENLPVLLFLITAPAVVESPLAREMADAQMRGQLMSLAGLCPLNTLRGISAFGTKLCFFTVDTNAEKPEVQPAAILREWEKGIEDVAPRDRWTTDLLSKEGASELMELVESIKRECDTETGSADDFMAQN